MVGCQRTPNTGEAIDTKVDKTAETFNFFLLFDEIVNTETVVEDEKGIIKKRTADRMLTSLYEKKTDRPLKGYSSPLERVRSSHSSRRWSNCPVSS